MGDMCAAMGELERQAKNWKEALRALRRAAEHFGTLEGAQHFQSATLNRVGFTYLEKGALKVCVCVLCVSRAASTASAFACDSLLDAGSASASALAASTADAPCCAPAPFATTKRPRRQARVGVADFQSATASRTCARRGQSSPLKWCGEARGLPAAA